MLETTGEPQESQPGARREVLSAVAVLGLTYGLLLWQFPPSLLFMPTIPAGGDTLSHYAAAKYLRDHLLPHGRLVGWMPGNFAGLPIFLFYFPLTFLVIAALSLVTPFPVAFKLGTVAGTFGLPLAALFALRWMGCRFPIPALGALFTLCFLFIESNSMWGGNIPSTLAGEFAYSFSLPILVVFLGVLYRGMVTKGKAWPSAMLFALVGFSHGYTMVMAAGVSLFFLAFNSDLPWTFRYLVRVYSIGGLLLGFWLLPLLVYLPYTSGWPISWQFTSALEPLPIILWPVLGAAVATVAVAVRRTGPTGADREWVRQVHYLTFPIVLSILLFSGAARLNLVDIRFLSMAQFFTTLVAAVGVGRAWRLLPHRLHMLALLALALLTVRWVVAHQTYSQAWIGTNYAGLERAPLWPQYRDLNAALKGGPSDPRVMYEHSPKHGEAGTIRAFEALPLFSGRSTLEGLYMQSSLSAPFIFYLQSELTTTPSCPFPQYRCSPFALDQAVSHLTLFNVKEFIAISNETKGALEASTAFRKRLVIEPYALYDVLPGDGHYVTPLRFEPTATRTKDWKRMAYDWFQRPDWLEVPLIFLQGPQRAPAAAVQFHGLEDGPSEVPLSDRCQVRETIREEEIRFETDCPGRPHLVKISFHPKWHVHGAETIYLASPAFMLVYPTAREVRLVFGNRWPDYVGWAATAVGILWLVAEVLAFPARRRYSQPPSRDEVTQESREAR